MMKLPSFVYGVVAVLAVLGSNESLRAHDPAEEMVSAAQVWLASLDEAQRAKVLLPFADHDREEFHFVPKPFEGEGMRVGLTFNDMRPEQRHLAYILLSAGLSHRGFSTALEIMSLEQILWELENEAPRRNPLMYYLTVFGNPGDPAWTWTIEGHHLSINFTIVDGKLVSGTPSFFASNPAEVREGPRAGLRVLADEEDQARALARSLDEGQKSKGLIADKAPRDILTSNRSKVDPLEESGIAFGELTGEQQKALKELMGVYLDRATPAYAAKEWKAIEEAGYDKIAFTWVGGLEKGEAHYYRVQGPTFLIEYSNSQNGANHVHSVWRNFEGDFGRDYLREHYQAYHQAEFD